MNSLERLMHKAANMVTRCEAHTPVEEAQIDVEQESLYLLRLAAIDAEERRFRQVQRDGRRALRQGCE